MLQIRSHGVDDYEALLDMDSSDVGRLSNADRECLRDLGDFLLATDAWKRLALWLLHKHFEPSHTELLVERVVDEKRTETSPVKRSELSRQVCPVAIRFCDDHGPAPRVVGLEYGEIHPWDRTAPLCDDDEPALAGIAHRLNEHGKMDRFGVKLLRNPLHISPAELLIETYDVETRTTTCTVGSRATLPADLSFFETTWRWRVEATNGKSMVIQDCTAGCAPPMKPLQRADGSFKSAEA